MPAEPTFARIAGFVASEADVAVILRRGPSAQIQMLRWDLLTDEVQPGQWLRAGIDLSHSDLSPDGRLFIGAFNDYSDRHRQGRGASGNGWTAISRPPYFTALVLWFDDLAVGGHWESARTLWTRNAYTRPDRGEIPKWLTLRGPSHTPIGIGTLSYIRFNEGKPTPSLEDSSWSPHEFYEARLVRDGWVRVRQGGKRRLTAGWSNDPELVALVRGAGYDVEQIQARAKRECWIATAVNLGPERWERPFSAGCLVREEQLAAVDKGGTPHLGFPNGGNTWSFLDVDRRGRVIYAEEGCLWAWADFPNGERTLIADLNANSFKPVAPPEWALEWPSS